MAERGRLLAAALAVLLAVPAAGQVSTGGERTASPPADREFADPFEAYQGGAWDQALEGFVGLQVERPEDPAVLLDLGSTHYRMRSWPEAEAAFRGAAVKGDASIRADALYNLGNCAYRQGRLEEAVERYRQALELDPDDQDAKFNLEFVREEIRRRLEEARERQQQSPPQAGGQEQEQEPAGGEQEPSPEEQGGEGAPEEGKTEPPSAAEGEGTDRDQDGLPDQVETTGENPTDPVDPDSDDDGLLDGEEDRNRDGRVGAGETDPNDPDSDDDGIRDGEEAPRPGQAGDPGPTGESGELTPEEAARYLDALTEDRPVEPRRLAGRPSRLEKDW